MGLNLVQKPESLSLNEMNEQFTRSLPAAMCDIPRGTRDSLVDTPFSSAHGEPLILPEAPKSLSRTQYRVQTLPSNVPLQHLPTDAWAAPKPRRVWSDSGTSSQGGSSVSQAGLEPIDNIGYSKGWHRQNLQGSFASPQANERNQNRGEASGSDALSRANSVMTNTVDQAHRRLEALFREHCPEVFLGPEIGIPETRVQERTTVDQEEAHYILVRMREVDPRYRVPARGLRTRLKLKPSKPEVSGFKNWNFSDDEKTNALGDAIKLKKVGVAEVLLEMGADANFTRPPARLSLLRKRNVAPEPTKYIQLAASNNDSAMVNLLASHGASLQCLEESLQIAVQHGSPDVIHALLQHGANPFTRGATILEAAIATMKPRTVRLLLRARHKAPKALLTKTLPRAVSLGQPEIVFLLVACGADVNDDHASALREAVWAQRIDIVLPIMKGQPSAEAVSSVFMYAFSPNDPSPLAIKYLLLETLLCGGAKGDHVADTLVQVVQADRRGSLKSLVELLITYGASLQYKNAEALRLAIAAQNVDLLRKLLRGRHSEILANDLFEDIPRPFHERKTYRLMSALIDRGARGNSLNTALVVSVQQKLVGIIRLLLDHDASVDHNNAQAIQIAAGAGDLENLNMLLIKGRPRPQSMQFALPLVPNGPPGLRYDMVKLIIDAASSTGIPQPLLNNMLVEATKPTASRLELDFIDLILVAGADVNCSDGKCFQFAVKRKSIELLEVLVQKRPLPLSLSLAITGAIALGRSTLRYRIIAILLDHGAVGDAVSRALIDALDEDFVDEVLITSLIAKSDVNYGQGKALSKAIQRCSVNVVSSILASGKANLESLSAALFVALEDTTPGADGKLKLILEAGIAQERLNQALVLETRKGRACNTKIVRLLLDHDASCNYDHGKALKIAIRDNNVDVVEHLVSSNPGSHLLATMLPLSMEITNSSTRTKISSSLLRAGVEGDVVSRALIHEIRSFHPCSAELVKILILHHANVAYSGGAALKYAISEGLPTDVIEIIVGGSGASSILASSVPLAMKHPQNSRIPILRLLLERGARGPEVDFALVAAVSEGPLAQLTIDILLQYGASVDFDNGRAVKKASEASNPSILQQLLNTNPNGDYLAEALQGAVRNTRTRSDSMLHPVRLLIRAGATKGPALHDALIEAVRKQDLDLVDHLLKNGADPNFKHGRCVKEATQQKNVQSLTLLANGPIPPKPDVLSGAFAVTAQFDEIRKYESDFLFEIHKVLLGGGASGDSVDRAFIICLASAHPLAAKFVQIALAQPAALNADFESGKCLCTAVKKNSLAIVRSLLERKPRKISLCHAFISIFESRVDEAALLSLVNIFFQHSGESKSIYFKDNDSEGSPLYQTLHRHPDKPMLLQCLLSNGCPADILFPWEFREGYGQEETSALLWVLALADPFTHRLVIEILLEHGGKQIDGSPLST